MSSFNGTAREMFAKAVRRAGTEDEIKKLIIEIISYNKTLGQTLMRVFNEANTLKEKREKVADFLFKRKYTLDIGEAIEKHDKLNPDLWDDNNELRPEVKAKLENIVQHFDDALKNDGVELDVIDVCIIGSNASYNYNPASDIDLHVIADTSVYDNEDLALKAYQAYKSLFNNKYDPMIRNHEVEIYVEPYEVHANSKGIYSLKDGWLKEPENLEIPEIDQNEVDTLLQPYIDRFNSIIEDGTVEDINKLIDDIYLERQSSIIKDGEFAIPNLMFKEFRANGYLQRLRNRKVELENKLLSLNDSFNKDLLYQFIDEKFDHIEESYGHEDLKVGTIFRSPYAGEIEIIKVDDSEVVYKLDDKKHPYQGIDTVDAFLYMLNNFGFEQLKEEYAELRNGIEFRFPEVRDTLRVYLQWEGIYGYADDILEVMEEYASYDFLDNYLQDESIFGFTQKIYDILMGEPAYCSKMDRGDFQAICSELGIDYKEAETYDGETITEENEQEAYNVNVDTFDNGEEITVTVDTVADGDLAHKLARDIDDVWVAQVDEASKTSPKRKCENIKEDKSIGRTNAERFLKYLIDNDCDTTGYFAENPVKIEYRDGAFEIRLYSQVSDMTFSFYVDGGVGVTGDRGTGEEDDDRNPIIVEFNEYFDNYSEFVRWYKTQEFTWTTDWGDNLTEAVGDTISDANVTFAVTKIVNDAKKDNLDPVKVLTAELRDGKLKDFDSLTIKDREYLRGHNGGWRVHNAATKKLLYSVPREAGPRGIASDIVKDLLSESLDLKETKKRISHDNEFDNGKVMFSYYNWTEDEAQEKAKEASLKDPKDIYYVKYDDIMNPAGDFIWFRGKQYSYKDRDKLRNVNESYLDNSDEYVIDRLKNDLLYNYKIKPADIVKKGDYFLVVFFTKEDKEKVMKRPDMLSPVRIKGELGYPYRFASIDINAMRKANNPKYDRIIRGYDEYTLQKKYNDFSIHSIDDVAEDELEEAFVLSIDDIKDEFKKMIDKHPEWSIEKAIEFAGDVLLDRGVSYKDLYKAKEEFEISLNEDYVLVRLSSGSRHNNKVEYSIEKVEVHKPDGGAITWGRHNEHKVDRMPSQIIASSDSKEDLELKARELVLKEDFSAEEIDRLKDSKVYNTVTPEGATFNCYYCGREDILTKDQLEGDIENYLGPYPPLCKECAAWEGGCDYFLNDRTGEKSREDLEGSADPEDPRYNDIIRSWADDKELVKSWILAGDPVYAIIDGKKFAKMSKEWLTHNFNKSVQEDIDYVGSDPDTGAMIYKGNGKYSTTYRGETMSADTLDELRDMLAVKWDNDTYNWSNLSENADELEDEPDWLVKWGKDPLNRLIGDRDTGDRNIKPGINWTWFWTDNKQDAIRWFKQLTGVLPYESTLVKDNKNWGFRLDREFVDELEEPIDDSDDWIGITPDYWEDDYKLAEAKLPDLPSWLEKDDPNFKIRELVKKAEDQNLDLSRVFNSELRDGSLKDLDDFGINGKWYRRRGKGWDVYTWDAQGPNDLIYTGTTPSVADDMAKFFQEYLDEDLANINPFLADLVSKSSSTLKKYLRDPKFSEDEKKQIRTELMNRGYYPRGKGPNSVAARKARNEGTSVPNTKI